MVSIATSFSYLFIIYSFSIVGEKSFFLGHHKIICDFTLRSELSMRRILFCPNRPSQPRNTGSIHIDPDGVFIAVVATTPP